MQAKRQKAKVGIKAIQEIETAKNHYKAEESWVITNNFYTKDARELAESNDVKLLDRYKLIELMTALNLSVSMTAGEFKQKVKARPIKCVCGAQMVRKKIDILAVRFMVAQRIPNAHIQSQSCEFSF